MKAIIQFSGGKDSMASLIWAVQTYGAGNCIAAYCDTGWESNLLYPYIKDVCNHFKVKLEIIRGELDFIQLAKKKKRFPSRKAQFCTQHLKVEPFIDWLIDNIKEHAVIIQGIRALESSSRAKMQPHCTYFKYYKEPYGHDKDGKPKKFTYRKKEVLAYDELYEPEIERPVFDKTAQEVIQAILDSGVKPCPLYYMGAGRVGCFPCINVNHSELYAMLEAFPDLEERVIEAEKEVGSSFFNPTYIPKRYCTKVCPRTKKPYATAQDVFKYVRMRKDKGLLLFESDTANRSCMTAFNICE